MVGSGGKVVSTADASFDFATDEGSVSGSNSAFRIRASFADSDVLIVSTAIFQLVLEVGRGSRTCSGLSRRYFVDKGTFVWL